MVLGNRSEQLVLLIFLGLALWASFCLFQPYLEPILLAVILATLVNPLHVRLAARLKRWPNLAACLSCLLISLLIILPASAMLVAVIQQTSVYAADLKGWVNGGGIEHLMQNQWVISARALLERFIPSDELQPAKLAERLLSTASTLGSGMLSASGKIATGLTGLVTEFFLMLFVLFFALRDHAKLMATLHHIIPLARSQEEELFSEIESVSRSALFGTLMTALIQGAAGGIAMAICGFPGLFWGAVMAFVSLIPVVGCALVWVPAALYLAVTGDMGWAIFLTVWGVGVVGSIDNFVRPLFMQGDNSPNTVVLFFSLLGGLNSFGLMGLLYGPLIVALTMVLFRLYEREFHHFLARQDRN